MTEIAADTLREEAWARIESDPRGALARYQHLVRIDPDDIESWSHSGNLLQRLGQSAAATEAFTQVLRLAERADNAEWVSYARRSLAQLGPLAPQDAGHPAATTPDKHAPPTEVAGALALKASGAGAARGTIAPAIAGAALTCVAGVGFLLLVTSGAVSQLWPYPFVRAALLRTIDNLTLAMLIGYFGSLLLQKAWSRHRLGRLAIHLGAGLLLGGALWLALSGLLPLGGIFAECAAIEDVKPACHIQIEEFERLTPEARRQLDVL